MPRPSPIPPAATTGTVTASADLGHERGETDGTVLEGADTSRGDLPLRRPGRPRRRTPARSSAVASSRVVAVPIRTTPSRPSSGGIPKVKLSTGTRSSATTWSWSPPSSSGAGGAAGNCGSPSRARCWSSEARSASSASASMRPGATGANRLTANGRRSRPGPRGSWSAGRPGRASPRRPSRARRPRRRLHQLDRGRPAGHRRLDDRVAEAEELAHPRVHPAHVCILVVDRPQELLDPRRGTPRLLDMRHVARLLEDRPLRARYPLVDLPDDQRRRLVVAGRRRAASAS